MQPALKCLFSGSLCIVALGGCGGDAPPDDPGSDTAGMESSLDTAGIESSLESALSGTGSSALSTSGPAITGVSCPDETQATEGDSFDCELSGEEGLAGTVTITLQAGGEFKYKGEATTDGYTTEVSGSASSDSDAP